MTAQPLQSQLARLEGACEQIADRLRSFEQRVDARFGQVDARFGQVEARFGQVDTRLAQLEQKIDANLRTTITWMLGQTAVILGAFAAFALHR